MAFMGGSVIGKAVDVLLPTGRTCEGSNGNEPLFTHIRHKIQTECLQIGDHNTVTIDFADLPEEKQFSDHFTTASVNNRIVFRVLRRNGSEEELVLINDGNVKTQTVDIQADFVRIIPSSSSELQEEMQIETEVDSRVLVQIGNNNHMVISSGVYPNTFGDSRPVLRFLRQLPIDPVPCCGSKSDFPNPEKDYLVAFEVNETHPPIIATDYDLKGTLTTSNSKDLELVVYVKRCANDGQTENNGFLLQKVTSLAGVHEFWFRFLEPKTRYFIRFSLLIQTALQTENELLDELTVSVETCASKTRHKTYKHRKKQRKPAEINKTLQEVPFRVKVEVQDSLPEQVNVQSAELDDFFECCNGFMEMLLELRNNGEWDKLDDEVTRLLDECTDINIRIAIMLEQGMTACCRGEPEVAEALIRKASVIFSKASPELKPLLKGRASSYLAAIYRRGNMKLGRAQKCIESAKNFLRHKGFVHDLGFVAYEEGCLLLRFGRKRCSLKKAMECFDLCHELCSRGTQINSALQKHHLSMVDEKRQAVLRLLWSERSGDAGKMTKNQRQDQEPIQG